MYISDGIFHPVKVYPVSNLTFAKNYLKRLANSQTRNCDDKFHQTSIKLMLFDTKNKFPWNKRGQRNVERKIKL